MVAANLMNDVLPIVIVAGLALAVVVWLAFKHVFPGSRAARHADHFFDGDSELSPQDQVKFTGQHPGAGGHG